MGLCYNLVITNTLFEFSSYHFLVQRTHVYIYLYIYIYARGWYAETSNPTAYVQNMNYPVERRSTVSLVVILLNLILQQNYVNKKQKTLTLTQISK